MNRKHIETIHAHSESRFMRCTNSTTSSTTFRIPLSASEARHTDNLNSLPVPRHPEHSNQSSNVTCRRDHRIHAHARRCALPDHRDHRALDETEVGNTWG